jgi:hypothetical protein
MLKEIDMETNIIFENLFIGFNPTNKVIESIITRLSQIILRIDRVNGIEDRVIKHEVMMLAKKYIHSNSSRTNDINTWRKFIIYLEGNS